MSGWRFAVFLTVVLSLWAVMHAYVFWRAASVPWVVAHCSRRTLLLTALALWLSYPLARVLGAQKLTAVAGPLEWFGAMWIGVLFLLFAATLAADALTLGGRWWPPARGWALAGAAGLAAVAIIQGFRDPVVREYEVRLPGLPVERDGMVLVAVSDIHLGTMIGGRWLARLVARINALRPDLIVAVGDIVDGEPEHLTEYIPLLRQLRAPLGVWAVTGNHEHYVGIARSVQVLHEAGWFVLRDEARQVAPGLVLAGVDDLTVRRQFGQPDDVVARALARRPPGATIFLSHTPWQAEQAARLGTGLMLAGHTHNGQIWPFTYIVGLSYPRRVGRYDVDGMTLLVGRGTGTWGPRMRLWQPSELLRIRLRTA